MRNPTQCVLWENPVLADRPKSQTFKRIVMYVDDSHLMRELLECRECGQLYFFEFYEEIDWENGNDPQYSTYIPVETEAEVETLKSASTFGLLKFFPRLQHDSGKDATTRWIGK
jgi:hypothetical protein